MKKKKLQHRYLQTLGVLILILALVRCVFPGLGSSHSSDVEDSTEVYDTVSDTLSMSTPHIALAPALAERPTEAVASAATANPATDDKAKTDDGVKANDKHEVGDKHEIVDLPTTSGRYAAGLPYYRAEGERPHMIDRSINCAVEFNDSNHVQLLAAERWGVSPVKNRADAEQRKSEVVFMGASPFYDMARLDASIPYLVPRASILLSDIGTLFMDSLQAKGLPLHHIIVSSVLRSEEDVVRLRRINKNATEQSCHLYGTTFDINYTTYTPLQGKEENWERLKWVLSEVLRDLHNQGRCYIKHEVRQPCFHITVR